MLEYYFPFGMAYFQSKNVSLREGKIANQTLRRWSLKIIMSCPSSASSSSLLAGAGSYFQVNQAVVDTLAMVQTLEVKGTSCCAFKGSSSKDDALIKECWALGAFCVFYLGSFVGVNNNYINIYICI